MKRTVRDLLHDAMQLSPEDRAQLAALLLETVEEQEIERRMAEQRAGCGRRNIFVTDKKESWDVKLPRSSTINS